MVKRHSLGSMTFSDYVAASIAERTGRTSSDWHSLVMEMGAQKTQPKVALRIRGSMRRLAPLWARRAPDLLRRMFEHAHKPVSKEEWWTAYIAGLDIGPEPPQTRHIVVTQSYLQNRDAMALMPSCVGMLCWIVCFWWMHRISPRQDAFLKELHEMTKPVEKLSQQEHDLISEVHPQVNEIKKHVENVREAVEQ